MDFGLKETEIRAAVPRGPSDLGRTLVTLFFVILSDWDDQDASSGSRQPVSGCPRPHIGMSSAGSWQSTVSGGAAQAWAVWWILCTVSARVTRYSSPVQSQPGTVSAGISTSSSPVRSSLGTVSARVTRYSSPVQSQPGTPVQSAVCCDSSGCSRCRQSTPRPLMWHCGL